MKISLLFFYSSFSMFFIPLLAGSWNVFANSPVGRCRKEPVTDGGMFSLFFLLLIIPCKRGLDFLRDHHV